MGLDAFRATAASVATLLGLAWEFYLEEEGGHWGPAGQWWVARFTHVDGSYVDIDVVMNGNAMFSVAFGSCDMTQDRAWYDALPQELHVALRKAGYAGFSCGFPEQEKAA